MSLVSRIIQQNSGGYFRGGDDGGYFRGGDDGGYFRGGDDGGIFRDQRRTDFMGYCLMKGISMAQASAMWNQGQRLSHPQYTALIQNRRTKGKKTKRSKGRGFDGFGDGECGCIRRRRTILY